MNSPFPQLSQFDFHHRLARTEGVALVIFTSPGCASCRGWKRLLAGYQQDHSQIGIFEVDAGRDQALAREFGVFHLPALFVYRHGIFHCGLQCEAKADKLQDTIEAALAAPAQDAP